MVLGIFSHLVHTQNICYHIWMEFCLHCFSISPASSTTFDPALVINLMIISSFFLFAAILIFPNRLIVVPLFIIIVSLKYEPSFVTFLILCKLIFNPPQPLVLILYTLTYASLSIFCSSPFYFPCWWLIYTLTLLSKHWYLAIVFLISQWSNICFPERHH